ncbi:hypothetical protein [Paraflavitalea speifideaquila]|uniref:hypothetical protein n=1 Tax=Paraflavitalea speifideaquila TaxID=3076558 RepID=UPI0028F10B42|nr:hypothetical protein [Paraflavitalea speifideiaquila]
MIKLFPDLLKAIAEHDLILEAREAVRQSIYQQLYYLAIQEAGKGIQLFKERNNVLGYDDLIHNLHHALAGKTGKGW